MNKRLQDAMAELNAAIREVEPTAKVESVRVVWRTGKRGRISIGGDLAQLIAWRLEGSQLASSIAKVMRALYK